MNSKAVSWFLTLGLFATGACGAEDPSAPGGLCIGMGANCAAGTTPCCSPLVCVAGRVCGVNSAGGVDSGTSLPNTDAGTTTTDSGTVGGCSDSGESCVASSCCGGLVCIAGRVCGDPPTGGTDGGASLPPTDGGSSSVDGGSSSIDAGRADSGGIVGMCSNASEPCDTTPCCAGLDCRNGDLGSRCVDPNAGGS